MFSQQLWSKLTAASFGLALLIANVSADFSAEYCSGLNTADTNKNSSIYQSNGLCHDFCISEYAFAVVQGDGCWCSNYVPGTTTSGCSQECPGFPSELCGGSGVFGYVALSKSPLGTKGASSPSAAPSTSPTPTTPSTQKSTSSTSSKTSSSSTQSSWTWTWKPTPVTSLETVTGQVRTVTVTPTVPPNSQNINNVANDSGGGKKGGLGTGAAVGLTIGLVAIITIIAAMAWFCVRKRRQDRAEEFANLSRSNSIQGALGGSSRDSAPTRTMSEHSRYMLNTNGRQVVETWEPEETGKRQSRLQPVDQRLDPFAPLYQRENRSRESVTTLQDHVDYSRRVQQPNRPILRVNNPDSD